MRRVTIYEAKTQLSALIRAVESGDDVVICRGQRPVALLTRIPEEVVAARALPPPLFPGFVIDDAAFAPLDAVAAAELGFDFDA